MHERGMKEYREIIRKGFRSRKVYFTFPWFCSIFVSVVDREPCETVDADYFNLEFVDFKRNSSEMTEHEEKQENTKNMSRHSHSYQHDTVLNTDDNNSPSKQQSTDTSPKPRKDSSAGENFLRFNHVLWPGTSSSHNGHQPALSDELFEFEETQYKRSKTRYDLATMFLLWVGCMLGGTHFTLLFTNFYLVTHTLLPCHIGMFYFRESSCCENRYGLSFYMAVNVFYAIGWSHPTNAATEESDALR